MLHKTIIEYVNVQSEVLLRTRSGFMSQRLETCSCGSFCLGLALSLLRWKVQKIVNDKTTDT